MMYFRCAPVFSLLMVSGCLQPGPKPEGTRLFPDRDIAGMGVLANSEGLPWGVVFSQRKALTTPTKGPMSDLWIAPLPENLAKAALPFTQPQLVVANRADRWGPAAAGQSFFTMVDERQVVSGEGQKVSVGTLLRFDPNYQINQRFENVSDFTLTGSHDDRLLYRQVPAGETPGLFIWDGQDALRLGDVANAGQLNIQVASSGIAYFILGSARTLSRLGSLTDKPQDLHTNVSRFLLRDDEKFATLALSDKGTTSTVVLDLQSLKEIPLARPNPCCWLGFAGNLFLYSQSAGPDSPAEYHTLDLATGTDTVQFLPEPLVDYQRPIDRPGSDEDLYVDSQGHGVFVGREDKQPRRVVQERMLVPMFSLDGRFLIYLDPQPLTDTDPDPHGPVMVRDADLIDSPRRLSSTGIQARADKFFFVSGPNGPLLVFWGYIVRASADLYFANWETGEMHIVAGGIGNVVVDGPRIFGTIHVSAQDAVGDLVVQDAWTQQGRTLSHAVADFAAGYGLMTYLVRGRTPSDHDGVWVTTIEPPMKDGGQ
jgi:hypothetical protein